jgi:hypothetical protein
MSPLTPLGLMFADEFLHLSDYLKVGCLFRKAILTGFNFSLSYRGFKFQFLSLGALSFYSETDDYR